MVQQFYSIVVENCCKLAQLTLVCYKEHACKFFYIKYHCYLALIVNVILGYVNLGYCH